MRGFKKLSLFFVFAMMFCTDTHANVTCGSVTCPSSNQYCDDAWSISRCAECSALENVEGDNGYFLSMDESKGTTKTSCYHECGQSDDELYGFRLKFNQGIRIYYADNTSDLGAMCVPTCNDGTDASNARDCNFICNPGYHMEKTPSDTWDCTVNYTEDTNCNVAHATKGIKMWDESKNTWGDKCYATECEEGYHVVEEGTYNGKPYGTCTGDQVPCSEMIPLLQGKALKDCVKDLNGSYNDKDVVWKNNDWDFSACVCMNIKADIDHGTAHKNCRYDKNGVLDTNNTNTCTIEIDTCVAGYCYKWREDGKSTDTIKTTCVDAPQGYYSEKDWIVCNQCPSGLTTQTTGAASEDACGTDISQMKFCDTTGKCFVLGNGFVSGKLFD